MGRQVDQKVVDGPGAGELDPSVDPPRLHPLLHQQQAGADLQDRSLPGKLAEDQVIGNPLGDLQRRGGIEQDFGGGGDGDQRRGSFADGEIVLQDDRKERPDPVILGELGPVGKREDQHRLLPRRLLLVSLENRFPTGGGVQPRDRPQQDRHGKEQWEKLSRSHGDFKNNNTLLIPFCQF